MKSLSLSKPHVILIVGIPGSGKTFFATQFAEMFQSPLVSSNKVKTILELAPQLTKKEISILSQLSMYQLLELCKTKQTVVYDSFAATRTERQLLGRIARAAGYELMTVWVQTDIATAKHRVTKATRQQPTPAYSEESYQAALTRFSAPHALEKALVISGKHTYASQVKIVLEHLVQERTDDVTMRPATIPERPKVNRTHRVTIR